MPENLSCGARRGSLRTSASLLVDTDLRRENELPPIRRDPAGVQKQNEAERATMAELRRVLIVSEQTVARRIEVLMG